MSPAEGAPTSAAEGAERPGARLPLVLLLALVPFALLTWRFDWLGDDGFISFRYARNLVEGHGLVYNPGADPPVEGYSEFLWVLALAGAMALGMAPEIAARVLGAACGALLVGLVARHVARRVAPSPRAAYGAALVLGTLPSLAVWSTSGLGTMPFVLAVWCLYATLLGCPDRPRGIAAGIAAAATVLVRAEGALWVAVLAGLALLIAWRRKDRCLGRAAWTAALLGVLALSAQLAFRLATYGDWLPNTARAKVDPSGEVFQRGARYVASYLATFPSVALALLLPLLFGRRCLYRATLVSAVFVLATAGYAILVGGDFMCFGRFLTPALPFVVVLLARAFFALEEDGRGSWVAGLALVLATLSLLPAWNVHVVPRRMLEGLAFRYKATTFLTEAEKWTEMKANAEQWGLLGKALALHTEPHESIVLGAVGATGYYSRLGVHDRYGLVTRGLERKNELDRAMSPGHDGAVNRLRFAKEATYIGAYLTGQKRVQPAWVRKHEKLVLDLPEEEFGEGTRLVLVRSKKAGES